MKLRIIFLLMLLQVSHLFSQERAWDIPESRSWKDALVPGLIAGGEILLVNSAFTLINWLSGWDWAVPSFESIRFNTSNPWIWEHDDGFVVNQLGHPFQGSLYFNAGRVNGFSFYQNLIFGVFGSAAWETSFENKHASINDFFTTVPGAFAAGEILYRLYVEAYVAGIPAPLAFILSPTAGLHRLLTDWEPPNANRNLYELRFFLGGGYSQTRSTVDLGPAGFDPADISQPDNSQDYLFFYNGPHGDAGFKVVYGNPFEQDTMVPYRHFEFDFFYGMNPGRFHDIRMISNGYLFSFSPVYTNNHTMSTGLTLNMDFTARGRFHMHDSTINQYSNALNWTIKYQYLLSQYTTIQIKNHTGITFLGASKYYSPEFGGDLNNFGYGLNSKLNFNLENSRMGRLELDLFGYLLWSYPGTSALSSGAAYWLFSDISYSRMVSEHISIGLLVSMAREWGRFDMVSNTSKRNDSIKLFVAWNL